MNKLTAQSQTPSQNPFPGLRPFRSDEHHLFFGREDQTAALLRLLRANRFLAIVGTSGSGKSSLVRAGMIAALHGGTMTHAGSTWEIILLRPGGNPIGNLARAFVEADLYDGQDTNTLPRLMATLSRSRYGLVEAVKQSDMFDPESNLLVVVDQFEELFRFRQQGIGSEEAAAAFVNLLLTASKQSEHPIYVAITMRSDYLGDCSEIPGLAEAVNDGEYLISRLLRDQKRDAIEKPIGVGGARIDPLLVQRLLNEVGDDSDQLPVLQHALMRMWDVWSADDNHDRPIELRDFEATGGLASALSKHADEVYDALPDDAHRLACEKIFKTLTEKGSDNRGIRRPTRLETLEEIAGSDRQTVLHVLNAFRQPGVTFLMPGTDVDLNDRAVIDLSHESLMRVWQRLCVWVEEEAQSARIFRRLRDTARLWGEGKAGLFRDPDLQIALTWRETESPNAEWAELYGGDFETAVDFLEQSAAEAKADQLQREAARQRELEQTRRLAEAERQRAEEQSRAAARLRWLVRGLGLVTALALVAMLIAWAARQQSRKNEELAANRAEEARVQTQKAVTAQQQTDAALTIVQKKEEEARDAADAARRAEQRSREFRYATDMELASRLLQDNSTPVAQLLGRLNEHDPARNPELDKDRDPRGFEWYYLRSLLDARASVFTGSEGTIVAAIISPQNELVTLDADGLLKRFDVQTRLETAPPLALHVETATRPVFALSPDGTRVAIAGNDTVQLLDASTGENIIDPLPTSARGGMVFTADSRMLVTLGSDLGWWDVNTGQPIAMQERASIYGSGTFALSADGLTFAVLTSGEDSTGRRFRDGNFSVFRLNPATREIVIVLDDQHANAGTIRTIALSPDGRSLLASQLFSGGIYQFDTQTGRKVQTNTTEHSASVSAFAFHPDSAQLVTASRDGMIKIWENYQNIESPSTTVLKGHAGAIGILSFSLNGRQLISSSEDRTTRVWDLASADSGADHLVSVDGKLRGRFSPDGLLFTTTPRSGALKMFDPVSGLPVASLPVEFGVGVNSLAFSPKADNRLLALGFGGRANESHVELWDIDGAERLATLPGSTSFGNFVTDEKSGVVSGLDFSPDGRYLVACFGSFNTLGGGDRGRFPLIVYDVASRRAIRYLEGHRNYCASVTFSSDGSRLASASHDGTARIWDTQTWQPLHVLENPDPETVDGDRRVQSVAFSPDGQFLAMASAEGSVIIWDAIDGRLLQTLRGHTNAVWSVVFSPDGRSLASAGEDLLIRLWNVATWRDVMRIDLPDGSRIRELAFSPEGDRLLAAGFSKTHIFSAQQTGGRAKQLARQLEIVAQSKADFRNRFRLISEDPDLAQALEILVQQGVDSDSIELALAAAQANRHAMRGEWEDACVALDRLTERSGEQLQDWLNIASQLRMTTALLHLGRPADAVAVLTRSAQRRKEEGIAPGQERIGLGFGFSAGGGQVVVTDVFAESPAARAGLVPGDVILQVNGNDLVDEQTSRVSSLLTNNEEPLARLSIRRLGSKETEVIALTRDSYLYDPATGPLVQALRSIIESQLVESPDDASLLELRAELAGHWNDLQAQLADYSTALDVLEDRTDDVAAKVRMRLHRRRGDIYVEMQDWQKAVEDFSLVAGAEMEDGGVRDKLFLAQANLALPWNTLRPEEMRSKGQATFNFQDDGSVFVSGQNPNVDVYTIRAHVPSGELRAVKLEAIPDSRLPVGSSGRASNGNFRLAEVEFKLISADDDQLADQPLTIRSGYSTHPGTSETDVAFLWDADRSTFWNHYPDLRELHSAVFEVDPQTVSEGMLLEVTLRFTVGNVTNLNLGRFRLSYSDDETLVEMDRHLANSPNNPWLKLAAIRRLQNDQASIDALVRQQPSSASDIGDLFLRDDEQDWQRAAQIYTIAIDAIREDANAKGAWTATYGELLARRARAYEALQDWDAAMADWDHAAKVDPRGEELLVDFARRLDEAEERDLANVVRQQLKESLESFLLDDPGNDPAIEQLAQVLIDGYVTAEPQWTVLSEGVVQSLDGKVLNVEKDGSILLDRDEPAGGFDSLILPFDAQASMSIRIEYDSQAASPSEDGQPAKEYQVLATDPTAAASTAVRGRYVRIDLPEDVERFPRYASADARGSRLLMLTEVEVFAGGRNVALGADASVAKISTRPGVNSPKNAVDGEQVGEYVIVRAYSGEEVWWEVDLGGEIEIDYVKVWSQALRAIFPDQLMSYSRVRVLDARRQVVFEQLISDPPQPSLEFRPQVRLLPFPSDAGSAQQAQRQLSFDTGSQTSRWRWMRISRGDRLKVVPGQAQRNAETSPLPAARLAGYYDLAGNVEAAAEWFERAWDKADIKVLRDSLLPQISQHPLALAELVRRRPRDPYLQLSTARNYVSQGQSHLFGNQPDQALVAFQKAREAFTELRDQAPQPRWNILTPNEMLSAGGATLTRQEDGSVFVSGDLAVKESFTLDFAELPDSINAIRLEALRDERLPSNGPGTHANGNFVLSDFQAFMLTQDGQEGMQPIPLKAELATFEERPLETSLLPGDSGWSVFGNVGRDQTAYFRMDRESVSVPGAMRIVLDFYHEPSDNIPALLGRFRLSATSDPLDARSLQLGHDIQQAESMELDMALGKAYSQLNRPNEAADAFGRAFERTVVDVELRKLLDELRQHTEVLAILAGQRPDDLQLQKALARSLAEHGKQALAEQPEQALVELERAQQIVTGAASQYVQPEWKILDATKTWSQLGATLSPQADGSILASGENPDQDVSYLIARPGLNRITAIRLEVLPDPSLPFGGPGRSRSGDFLLSEIRVYAGSKPVSLTEISVDFFAPNTYPAAAIDGAIRGQTGWRNRANRQAHTAYISTDMELVPDEELKFELYTANGIYSDYNLGRFRISVSGDDDAFDASRSVQQLQDSDLNNLEALIAGVNARLGRMPEAASAFSRALDQTIDPTSRTEILRDVSAHEGLLDRLTQLRSEDADFHALLAKYFRYDGDENRARQAADRARTLYELQLEQEPSSQRVVAALADVLLELERTKWQVVVPAMTELRSDGGARLSVLKDKSILASGIHADRDIYTIPVQTDLKSVRAIRLEALTDDSLPDNGPGRAGGRLLGLFVLDRFEVSAAPQGAPDSSNALHFSRMTADHHLKSQPLNPETGKWHIWGGTGSPRVAFFEVEESVDSDTGLQLEFRMVFDHPGFVQLSLGRFRLSVSDNPRIYSMEEDFLQIKSPWLRLGVLYHALGEAKKSRDAFNSAISLTHDNEARVVAATLAAEYAEPFADLLAQDPDNPVLQRGQARYRGQALIDEGMFAESVDVLSEALKSFPTDTQLLMQRADAYQKLANWQRAIDDCSQVIELETDDVRLRKARRERAVCRIRLGEFQEAADLLFTEMLLRSPIAGIQDALAAQFLADKPDIAKVAATRLGQRLQEMDSNDRPSDWLQSLTYAYTAHEGLIPKNSQDRLLAMTGNVGDEAQLTTAAIHYRLGNLDQASMLLDAAEDKPYFRSLAAMLLIDRGETARARGILEDIGNWIQNQREQDPGSAIPAQQDWRTWAIQLAVYQEALRKLDRSDRTEENTE